MNKLKTRKGTVRLIRFCRPVLLLLSFLMLQGCALPVLSTKPSQETDVRISSTEPQTSTSETKQDIIYFWWNGNGKSELWRLEPDGASRILYSVTVEHTLEEVTESGLLSKETAQSIK